MKDNTDVLNKKRELWRQLIDGYVDGDKPQPIPRFWSKVTPEQMTPYQRGWFAAYIMNELEEAFLGTGKETEGFGQGEDAKGGQSPDTGGE